VLTRRATPADTDDVAALAWRSYAGYEPRIGRPPAPALADYDAHIRDDEVWVVDGENGIVGFVVLLLEPDCVLLEAVAVDPVWQGRGIGRALVDLAEQRCRDHGRAVVRLYTNETMVENLAMYAHLGYSETHRARQDGYARVFFTKTVTPAPR
jgi:GNAT superfamily N-acetyltransferase